MKLSLYINFFYSIVIVSSKVASISKIVYLKIDDDCIIQTSPCIDVSNTIKRLIKNKKIFKNY